MLNDIYSEGDAINSSGQVVGQASVKNNSGYIIYHAVKFSGGKAVDLNGLIPAGTGWLLTQATGINDSGQIAGIGTIHNQQHAFLLAPK
ncbi:MAG TPA: hypothetical protein VKV15_20095 [Bryobacteraceae bacterium]|nr:hypothetical protein [Bryobacteraceae bacterium]